MEHRTSNAMYQERHRQKKAAEMDALREENAALRKTIEQMGQAQRQTPRMGRAASKGAINKLGLLTLTEDEFAWLTKMLIERRDQPARVAAQEAAAAAREASIQSRRQAQWDKATMTAPLYRWEGMGLVPVENRVLSATRQHVKGIYRWHYTGRLELFTLTYEGWREEHDKGFWSVSQGRNYLEILPGTMEAAGYRAEAPKTKYPWEKRDEPRPYKDATIAELRKLRSANHPDKNGAADVSVYQAVVEELDRRKVAGV